MVNDHIKLTPYFKLIKDKPLIRQNETKRNEYGLVSIVASHEQEEIDIGYFLRMSQECISEEISSKCQ